MENQKPDIEPDAPDDYSCLEDRLLSGERGPITFRISKNLRVALKVWAAMENRTMGEVVEEAIVGALWDCNSMYVSEAGAGLLLAAITQALRDEDTGEDTETMTT